jgi:hypothetical protein
VDLDLAPPKNWQDFETLCHALWEREWNCPTIQRNGRSGQQQRGVDIFGRPNGGGTFHGIQCKLKTADASRPAMLTKAEVRREVDEARKFTPPLEHLIIATTAPADVKIQAFVRVLSDRHAADGMFRIDVLAWPEIQARLAKHSVLIDRFYPGARGHIRIPQNQSRQARVPMMAPEPPAAFVERPTEFNALRRKLLDAKGSAVAISAALKGAGGYGKTTLAKALAHDPDIQDAYSDGILWVVLGEKPDNLLSIVSDLIEVLAGERPALEKRHGRRREALGCTRRPTDSADH